MSTPNPEAPSFRDLALGPELLEALDEVGYETPSPIQTQAIPHLLEGLDILGHAPTGTGKTAAFALPLIAKLDTGSKRVQVLTLTPTRELAIQVAEAFQRYASRVPGFHVLPIYGGQDIGGQHQTLTGWEGPDGGIVSQRHRQLRAKTPCSQSLHSRIQKDRICIRWPVY